MTTGQPAIEQSILLSQARAAGAAAERKRIAAILNSREAEGREKLALHFALATDLDPKAAQTALAASPVASKGDESNATAPRAPGGKQPNCRGG